MAVDRPPDRSEAGSNVKVLIATYPLCPVTPPACGGTEQIAWLLLTGLAADLSLQITWIGAAGSAVAPRTRFRPWTHGAPSCVQPPDWAALQRRCNDELVGIANAGRFDLVHNLGACLHGDAARLEAPVLFSLHLARELYPAELTLEPPANLHFHCVSHAQAEEYGEVACCGVIPNGIAVDEFRPRQWRPAPSAPLLFLGRICWEKGPDRAIALARRLGRRLLLVGEPGPFPAHRRFFDEAVAPHLGDDVRWLPPPSLDGKRTLLRQASAVVVCSRVSETSSLVAMEAAASGVPVLALRRGALAE